MAWILLRPSNYKQVAPLVRTGGSRHTGLAALPHRNIQLAIDTNHISYSFIKNSIAAVAEEIGSAGFNTKLNEERNKGAFVMSPHAGDIDRLLSKSSKLAGEVRDEEA